MNYRYYINEEDSHNGEFNYLITPDGETIEYSYACQGNQMPPEGFGYRLVYETDDESTCTFEIDPYGMRGLTDMRGGNWNDSPVDLIECD